MHFYNWKSVAEIKNINFQTVVIAEVMLYIKNVFFQHLFKSWN